MEDMPKVALAPGTVNFCTSHAMTAIFPHTDSPFQDIAKRGPARATFIFLPGRKKRFSTLDAIIGPRTFFMIQRAGTWRFRAMMIHDLFLHRTERTKATK